MPGPQPGQQRSKKGYTFIEVTAVAAIIAVVLSMVMEGYKTRINKAKLEETVDEMMSLGRASLDFYNSRGSWPMSPSDLVPTYMYAAVVSSPFGGEYQINGLNKTATISTIVPSGLAQNYYQGTLLEISPGAAHDTILITQRPSNELSGRLEYAKKYTYRQ